MKGFSGITVFFILFSILIILQFHPVILKEVEQNVTQHQQEKAYVSKILMDTISLLQRSHTSSWEKIKTVTHDMRKQFSPSTLEGVGETETELGIGGVEGTIKETVTKNFEKCEEIVKESTKSAANVVEAAAPNTAEKVTHEDEELDAEL